MTLIIDRRPPRRSFAGRLAAGAFRLVGLAFGTIAAFIGREIDRRRTASLLGYDDNLLADIGLSRSDVHAAVMTSGEEKASERLSRQRRERWAAERAQAREKRSADRR